MTDGRRTPVGDIADLKNIDCHEKLGVFEKLGVGATPALTSKPTSATPGDDLRARYHMGLLASAEIRSPKSETTFKSAGLSN